MRKYKAISVLLTIAVLVSGVFNVYAFASESCLKDSFENLVVEQSYVPPNPVGNCYYTAISMMLMYYDTYWHEDFVADNLEWSPGIYDSSTQTLVQTFSARAENDAWNTYSKDSSIASKSPRDFYLRNANNYLQSHLIARGIAEGYHPYDEDNSYKENNIFSFSSAAQCKLFLNSYLSSRNLNGDKVSVRYEYGTQEQLSETMAEKVSMGYPVLYIGWRETYTTYVNEYGEIIVVKNRVGHVLLAYGIDDDGDIMLHCGWNIEGTFDQVGETQYSLTPYIVWLDVDAEMLSHKCSNNYREVSTNQELCSCQIYYDTHLSHGLKSNPINHWSECECGYHTDAEPHVFTYVNINDSVHRKVCIECGYQLDLSHSCDTLVSISDTEHQAICQCGYVSTEEHTRGYCAYDSANYHNVYCNCNQHLGLEVHDILSGIIQTYCRDCLYVFESSIPSIRNDVDDDILSSIE